MDVTGIVMENLLRMKFKAFTEVQKKSIPLARSKHEFWARSSTGTGKTAAFIIPLVERAIENSSFQVLVLEPSRELAIQAANECRKIAQGTGVSVVAAYGGTDVDKQVELIEKGEDPDDPGGYFVLNGNERVLIMVEDLASNTFLIEKDTTGTSKFIGKLFSEAALTALCISCFVIARSR